MSQLLDIAHTKPTTRGGIYEWVKFFLKFDLHTCVRCHKPNDMTLEEAIEEGYPHNCQLDYVESCFLRHHNVSLLTGARGSGKSEQIAILSLLNCLFYPGIYVLNTAFTAGMCNEVMMKFTAFLAHYKEITGECPNSVVMDGTIRFKNGSRVEFRTGNGKTNVASRHPDIMNVDECDKFNYDAITTIENSVTERKDKNFGYQINLISTSYSMSETSVVLNKVKAYKEFNETKQQHQLPMKVFRVCLLDILETCDSRYQCFNEKTGKHCGLWDYCGGKAKDIKGGYYPIDRALTGIAGEHSRRNFDAEMFLRTPVPEGAYFPGFSTEHIIDPPRPFDPSMETALGWDFGGIRCPHCCIVVQRDKENRVYVIDEFSGMNNFELLVKQVKTRYPGIERYSRCFCDPAGNKKDAMIGSKSYVDVLKEAGWAPRSTTKCKRADSFEQVLSLISPANNVQKFQINKTCKGTIRQIQQARRKPDGKPEDGAGDDYLDCLRYVVYWLGRKNLTVARWVY